MVCWVGWAGDSRGVTIIRRMSNITTEWVHYGILINIYIHHQAAHKIIIHNEFGLIIFIFVPIKRKGGKRKKEKRKRETDSYHNLA